MATTAKGGGAPPSSSIKTIWGFARSEELNLSKADLYAIIFRETGKDSMRALTGGEINDMVRVLRNMKDATQKKTKRLDDGGSTQTESQRRKIFALCRELGWGDDTDRINGFVRRVCRVDRIEWLKPWQCEKVIEGLKAMVARKDGGGQIEGG